MSIGSFSIGLRFYYWDYYKELDELPADEQTNGTISYHSGYKVSELYVDKKYGSFGEEIMNYNHIEMDIKKFRDLIIKKAEQYINTKRVKAIKPDTWESPKHYGVDDEAPLSVNNLLSVILYTDTTTLSGGFSGSFRKIFAYETLSQIKTRNSKYWHWSKYLRETVEMYGSYTWNINPPFYTGINCVLEMPSFSIRLCSPTSTSVHLEVAVKFGGQTGLILQLNTKGMLTGYSSYLKGFDCSFLSQFKEEDERCCCICFALFLYKVFTFVYTINRLFFGGFKCIAIQSIRLMQNNKNFEQLIKILYCFDSITSGIDIDYELGKKITKSDVNILKHLFDIKCSKQDSRKYDGYIYQTYQCFIKHKQQIHINMWFIEDINEDMRNLIIHPIKNDYESVVRSCGDVTNLFRKKLLEIFHYATKIVFDLSSLSFRYRISLESLLSIIEKSSVEEIVLVLGKQEYYNKLCSIYPLSEELKERYNKANYNISDLKQNAGSNNKYVVCVIRK